MNLNEQIALGRSLRDQIEGLEKELRALKEQKDNSDSAILDMMEEQGIERTGTDHANVSVSNRNFASVRDWDALYAYARETGYLHIFQKRVAMKSIEEIIDVEGPIEAISIESKPVLNFRRK